MYGKHFESMYTGSMIGSGAAVFAVWGYVVANMKPPSFEVELNPKLLAFILGESEGKVEEALGVLCGPDPRSRTKVEEGRRLVRRGEFLYFVVNGEHYTRVQSDGDKRRYWREQKRRQKEERELSVVSAPAVVAPQVEEAVAGPQKARRAAFVVPTLEEVRALCVARGMGAEEAEAIWNHYESNGWMVGRNKMVSVAATVAKWAMRKKGGTYGNYEGYRASGGGGIDRNEGTANEGKASQYAGMGKMGGLPGLGG